MPLGQQRPGAARPPRPAGSPVDLGKAVGAASLGDRLVVASDDRSLRVVDETSVTAPVMLPEKYSYRFALLGSRSGDKALFAWTESGGVVGPANCHKAARLSCSP